MRREYGEGKNSLPSVALRVGGTTSSGRDMSLPWEKKHDVFLTGISGSSRPLVTHGDSSPDSINPLYRRGGEPEKSDRDPFRESYPLVPRSGECSIANITHVTSLDFRVNGNLDSASGKFRK